MPTVSALVSGSDQDITQRFRPDFDKVIESGQPLRAFRNFCEQELSTDLLDCFLAIKLYKKFFEKSSGESSNKPSISKLLNFGRSLRKKITKTFQKHNTNDEGSIGFSEFDDDSLSSMSDTSEMYVSSWNFPIEVQAQAYAQLKNILNEFIMPNAPRQINVEPLAKDRLTNDPDLTTFEAYLDKIRTTEKYSLFDEVEVEVVFMLMNDLFPKFIISDDWKQFRDANVQEAYQVCVQYQQFEKINANDFKRSTLTHKDINMLEMIGTIYCDFEALCEMDSVSVYMSKADQIVDEKDVGTGSFSISKIAGYLYCSAEFALTCFVDVNFLLQNVPYHVVEHEEDGTPTHRMKRVEGSEIPCIYCKYHMDPGKVWDLRTTQSLVSIMYRNGQYIKVVKSISDEKNFPSNYVYFENGEKKVKKTMGNQMYMIDFYTPISYNRCHVTSVSIINPGGFMSLNSTMFKNSMGPVWLTYRKIFDNSITLLHKERGHEKLYSGYQITKACLEDSLLHDGKTLSDCPYPNTMQEFIDNY